MKTTKKEANRCFKRLFFFLEMKGSVSSFLGIVLIPFTTISACEAHHLMREKMNQGSTFSSISPYNHKELMVSLRVSESEYDDLVYFNTVTLLGQMASREYGITIQYVSLNK